MAAKSFMSPMSQLSSKTYWRAQTGDKQFCDSYLYVDLPVANVNMASSNGVTAIGGDASLEFTEGKALPGTVAQMVQGLFLLA